jgi:hypothetical protein
MESFESPQSVTIPTNDAGTLDLGNGQSIFRLLLNIEFRLRKEVRDESGIGIVKRWIFGSQNDGPVVSSARHSSYSKSIRPRPSQQNCPESEEHPLVHLQKATIPKRAGFDLPEPPG